MTALTTLQAQIVNLLRTCGPLHTDELATKLGKPVASVSASVTSLGNTQPKVVSHQRIEGCRYVQWSLVVEEDANAVASHVFVRDPGSLSPAHNKDCRLVHTHDQYAWVINPLSGHVCRVEASWCTVTQRYPNPVSADQRALEQDLKNERAARLRLEGELRNAIAELQQRTTQRDLLYRQCQANTSGTYVLWSPESRTPPSVTYDGLAQGQSVARAMAERYQGQTFNLCRLVEAYQFIKPVPVKSGLIVEKL